ncbi:spore germination protein [Paenibacillus alba]|uniref:Spore germination protein n=1 Tax=Paenibacillus alba TaxID=1197127 RepID=A0ABU6G521_9BACL|nr:spore germination protein [Paenibacillus alba]MEC0229036.1 spore germination protein [Paenibacillus alba]
MPGKDVQEQSASGLEGSLTDHMARIQRELGASDDLIFKKFQCMQVWPAVTIYIDGMVDSQLHNAILQSLMLKQEFEHDLSAEDDRLEYVQQYTLIAAHSGTFNTYKELYDRLLSGHAILLLDNEKKGLWIELFDCPLPHDTILDGELIVTDDQGKPDFEAMSTRFLSNKDKTRVTFCAFDILRYKGIDATGLPLLKRKELLEESFIETERYTKVKYSKVTWYSTFNK